MPHTPNLARYRSFSLYKNKQETEGLLAESRGKHRGVEVVVSSAEETSHYFGVLEYDLKKGVVTIGEENTKEIPLKDITKLLVPQF